MITPFALNSAATTNATLVSPGMTRVYQLTASNVGAGAAFLKLYNIGVSPTVGTTVPRLTIPIAASGTVSVNFGQQGHRFPSGFALAITNLVADSDTTAVAAAQVKVVADWDNL